MSEINIEKITKLENARLCVKVKAPRGSGGIDYIAELYYGKEKIGQTGCHISHDEMEDIGELKSNFINYFANEIKKLGYITDIRKEYINIEKKK